MEHCRRCIRANETCFTGPARRAGRPQRLFRSQSPVVATQPASSAVLQTPPASTNDASPADDSHLHISGDGIAGFGNASEPTPFASSEAVDGDVAHRLDQITRRSECMKSLGRLQSDVIHDVDLIKGCRTAPSCVSVTNPEDGFGAPNPDFMIGRLLNHSKALLEILDCFDLSRDAAPYGTKSPDGRLFCDMPAMFSMMSCYICLIRTYRTIFACLLESLPFFRDKHHLLPDPLLQILPSLDFGGFTLNDRVDLQLQILVQVSEDMLRKLEDKFGLGRGTTTGTWLPTSGPTKATGLLWMMLEQEIAEEPPLDEPRGHSKSLKEILTSIKKELRMDTEVNSGLPVNVGK